MLQTISMLVFAMLLQEESLPQAKVTEKLEINCQPSAETAQPETVETADEKAARLEADFEKALMQMDKCLNKVVVSAAGAGGGGGNGSGDAGAGSGSGSALKGTEQQTAEPTEKTAEPADNNGAPATSETTPTRQAPPTSPSKTNPDTPADIPGAASDDVVAQQLRELAEKEPDPELKKKYWNQYRKYKGLKEID